MGICVTETIAPPPPHPILSCSLLSIMAARARTPLMISFSSSVSSAPGGPPGTFIVHLIRKRRERAESVSQSRKSAAQTGKQKCTAKEMKTLNPSDGSTDANIFHPKATLSNGKSVYEELLALNNRCPDWENS